MAVTLNKQTPPNRLHCRWVTTLVVITTALLIIAGCATKRPEAPYPRPAPTGPAVVNLSDTQEVKTILYRQLQEWQGVRYRIGGMSKKGIDCSGFVHLTFRSKFGIDLPRTTALQAATGSGVPRKKLKAGDLVFFKTGFKLRHVGIYVENKKFIHASTSRGVILSRLDEAYWNKRYWRSVRIKI